MKITKIAALSLLGMFLLAGGCEWLELLPQNGLVVDEYWQSKEDVEATLMGAYQQFALMDEKLFLYGEIRADMIDAVQAPDNEKQIMNSNIYSINPFCNWGDFYRIINYCNNVIVFAPEVQSIDNSFTEYQRISFQSEAIFLRSLAYFYLVRIFKDVPYVTTPSIDDNVDFFLPKSPGDSILAWIKKDLIAYRLTSPSEYGTVSENKGRATKSAVNALLADICLWTFEYEESLKYIEDIENSGQFFLVPPPKYIELYLPGNSIETIFELQFDGTDMQNSLFLYTFWWDYYTASEQAINILSTDEADEFTRGVVALSLESFGYKIWKYIAASANQRSVRSSSDALACNFIIYRYADVILMKAEALSQLGRFNEAQYALDLIKVRARIKLENISNSAEAFETAIMEERAKELAFEGKRWFDLMRMGRRDNYARKNELIEVIIRNAPSTLKLVLASKLSNPLGWYLPIYEQELERNTNLEQNPYYDIDL